MASSDLISNSRAIQNGVLSSLNSANPSYLASLISAASAAVKRLCKRDFLTTSYTEYASGGNFPYDILQLRQFPVTEITRIATNPVAALLVSNTSTSNQRATVETTSTGLKLVCVASGVSSTSTLTYASYVTLTAMATAINALGNGWAASVVGPYTLHASADLTQLVGAATAINGGAYLTMYAEDRLSSLGFSTFEQFGGDFEAGEFWRLDEEAGILFGKWPKGTRNIRIDYSAGLSSTADNLPQDLQEAVVQHVQDLYQGSQLNQSISSATLGQASYTLKTLQEAASMSGKVMQLLQPYIDHAKALTR